MKGGYLTLEGAEVQSSISADGMQAESDKQNHVH